MNSYNAIHGTNFEPSDIRDIKGLDLGIVDVQHFTYLLTYSFPCQDLSVAGKGAGMTKGSGTRSGLLWEVERLLNEVENLPQVLLMENVPQVHGTKNMADFQKWISFLESKGYSNYWQDLNAKNYGVAQNRNRCFMVSILGDYKYEFPKPIELTKRMKDYLEDEVDEKYYINNEKADKLIQTLTDNGIIGGRVERSYPNNVSTLQSTSLEKSTRQTVLRQDMMQESATSRQMEVELLSVNELGFIEKGTGQHQSNTVYGTDGICPCEYSVQYKEPFKILE
jgi:DNA-cytosine methyltransferase